MNSKHLSIICAFAASATLAGCSSTRSTPSELSIKLTEPFKEYNLSLSDSEKPHSTAMQYMHLVSRERVHKANDLDANMDGYTNVGVRSTQGLAAAGVLTGSLNPFQAAFSMIGQQSNLSKLAWNYRENTLLIISPLPSLKPEDITMVIKESRGILIDILSDAYHKDGSSVKVINTKDANWLRGEYSYVIPTDDVGAVADCYYPNVLKNIETAVKGDYKPRRELPADGSQGCFSQLAYYSKVYTSNGHNGKGLPSGNFVVSSADMPAIFPLDKLSSSERGVYLYQPSISFMKDRNLINYVKNDKFDDIRENFKEEGIFRLAPRVTDLSTGELLEFGF